MSIFINVNQNNIIAGGGFDTLQSHVIKDEELKAFGLDNKETIKNEIEKCMGAKPQYIWYKNPTQPCDRPNMYTDFNWPQVTTNLVFSKAELVSNQQKIISKNKFLYENNSSVEVSYTASLTYTNTESVTHSSAASNAFKAGANVKVKIMAAEVGASFEYTHNLTETETHNVQKTISINASTSLKLQPKQAVYVELVCREVKTKVKLIYNAFLTGGVAVEYGYWYKDHRKYRIDSVISGRHSLLEEYVEITGCCDWELKVYDKTSNDLLINVPVILNDCIGE